MLILHSLTVLESAETDVYLDNNGVGKVNELNVSWVHLPENNEQRSLLYDCILGPCRLLCTQCIFSYPDIVSLNMCK